MSYFRLERWLRHGSARIYATSHADVSLSKGALLPADLSVPFTFDLDLDLPGTVMGSLFLNEWVFRRDFVDTLSSLGVSNFQTFPAVIRNPETEQRFEDFLVVNILGLVNCAELDRSEYDPLGETIAISHLVIKPERTHGLDVFRVAEDPELVLVSERIAKPLAARFRDVIVTPVEDA